MLGIGRYVVSYNCYVESCIPIIDLVVIRLLLSGLSGSDHHRNVAKSVRWQFLSENPFSREENTYK